MEYALCVVVGVLLGMLLGRVPKRSAPPTPPTEEEERRASAALRDYQRFLRYDGFSSPDEE